MFPKEIEISSVPTLSFDRNKMLEQDFDEYGIARGDSFLDIMKQNVPSVARIPSPKPHRKGHHHHHHHHHNKQNSSDSPTSVQKRKLGTRASVIEGSSFLSVTNDPLRMRSYSDSSLNISEHRQRVKSPLSSPTTPRSPNMNYQRQKGTDEPDNVADEIVFSVTNTNGDDSVDQNHSTISRDLLTNPNDVLYVDGTMTRRKTELVDEVKGNEKQASKKKTLKMIDQIVKQCTSNNRTIETEIDFVFTRLHTALENRRKELVDEAKSLRDAKIANLNKSKERCLKSESIVALHNSDNDSDHASTPSSRRNSGEHDECLQSNGILEPWKTGGEHNECDVALEKVVKKFSVAGGIFSDILDEGNTSFTFNEETMEIFSTIGSLQDTLSSPQYSFTKGLHNGMALAGETVRYEVHTRNKMEEITHNSRDVIKCHIYKTNGNKVDVTKEVSLQRSNSNGRICPASPLPLHKFYSYVFTPKNPGKYEIHITVNNVDIKNSPFKYSVYPKVNLTFDVKSPAEKMNAHAFVAIDAINDTSPKNLQEKRQKGMIRRESSEDADWADHNWIVQKGDKSSLLRSVKDVPSYIYAAPSVTGFCAWKLRVTSACESIVISIGVGTRSGIPDIDEHYSCDFDIEENKNKNKKPSAGGRLQVRRTSSFTRISLTYDVLFSEEEGVVRVISEHSDENKTVEIDPKILNLKQFELYPFISMVHRHDSCGRQVCPRPQITLL